jgi:opacity protein-like surface antigen
MLRKAAILGIAMLAVLAGSANAGTNWFGVTGGMGIPTGDYSDAAANGWHIGATGTHMMNDQWASARTWRITRGAARTTRTRPPRWRFGPGSEFKWSAIQATAHGVMAIPTQGSAKPYLKAGLGLYDLGLKLDTPGGNVSDSNSEFGFNVGGGVNFVTHSSMRWGVDAAYHIVQAKNDVGSDVNFFQVGLDVMWGEPLILAAGNAARARSEEFRPGLCAAVKRRGCGATTTAP